MRKTAVAGVMLLMAGCAAPQEPLQTETQGNMAVEQAEYVAEVNKNNAIAVPCSYSCNQYSGCYSTPQPMVLKPRVTETIKSSRKRRCCADEPVLPGQEDIVYVPDAPEIYVISANRTVNSMQKEAAPFFEQVGNMKVYVDAAKPKADDLPGGTEKGTETLKKRFSNMSNIIVVDNPQYADFVVNSVIDWYDTPTKKVPAIKYDMFLNAKDGHVIGEWSEIIHQAEGDRSWW